MIIRSVVCVMLGIIPVCFISTVHAEESNYAKRMVSLAPAITEMVYALEAEDQLVGVSSYCDYPEAATTKEKVGGFINPNLEKIISLKPDTVLVAANSGTKAIKEHLDSLGVRTVVIPMYTINDLKTSYTLLGEVVGKKDKADALRLELIETMMNIKERVVGEEKPRVLIVRAHTPLCVAGKGTYEDDVIRACGGENCVREEARYPLYSIEAVVRDNPSIIIDATYYETPSPGEREEIRSFWKQLPSLDAVKNNRIYIIKTDIHSVPGPRTPLFLRIMAQLLHPTLWGEEKEYSERIGVTL